MRRVITPLRPLKPCADTAIHSLVGSHELGLSEGRTMCVLAKCILLIASGALGLRPEFRHPFVEILSTFIDPFVEFSTLTLLVYVALTGQQSYVNFSIFLIYSLITVKACAVVRKWTMRNRNQTWSLLKARPLSIPKLSLAAVHFVNPVLNLIIDTNRMDSILDCTSLFCLNYISFRCALGTYLSNLLVLEVSSRIQRRSQSGSTLKAEKLLRAYKDSCTDVEELDANFGGVLDWVMAKEFCNSSIINSWMLMSRCDFSPYLVVSATTAMLPIIGLVGFMSQISEVMRASRNNLRRVWVGERNSQRVHVALSDISGQGLRWKLSGEVVDWASTMFFLNKVTSYSALILTTPLFRENNIIDSFC